MVKYGLKLSKIWFPLSVHIAKKYNFLNLDCCMAGFVKTHTGRTQYIYEEKEYWQVMRLRLVVWGWQGMILLSGRVMVANNCSWKIGRVLL